MPPKQVAQQVVQQNGLFIYPNGDTYDRDYIVENEAQYRNGSGIYLAFSEESLKMEKIPLEIRQQPIPSYYEHDVIQLKGTWLKDVFQEGEITFANQAKYTGKLDGLNYVSGASYQFPNGVTYTGEFKKNLLHGVGTVVKDGVTIGPGIYRNNYGEGLM